MKKSFLMLFLALAISAANANAGACNPAPEDRYMSDTGRLEVSADGSIALMNPIPGFGPGSEAGMFNGVITSYTTVIVGGARATSMTDLRALAGKQVSGTGVVRITGCGERTRMVWLQLFLKPAPPPAKKKK